MKETIRFSTFETNSSSTHSLCLAKSNNYEIPEYLEVNFDEFEYWTSWTIDKLTTPQQKICYLLALAYDFTDDKIKFNRNKMKQIIFNICNKYGCIINFVGDLSKIENVDHIFDLNGFITNMLKHEKVLLRFIFNNKCFVLTGNDNVECDLNIEVDYPALIYYKGN